MKAPLSSFHERRIHRRRVERLATHLAEWVRSGASVLDVGCGDGQLSARVARQRPDVSVSGIDVLVRDAAAIPVEPFDGVTIPRESDSLDTVLLIDVLHHTDSPGQLLSEAVRVARKQVIVKDHYLRGPAAHWTLSLMDHVGNARHGVRIPCNYLTPEQWEQMYLDVGLRTVQSRDRLGLYAAPLSWWFERGLHFMADLEPRQS